MFQEKLLMQEEGLSINVLLGVMGMLEMCELGLALLPQKLRLIKHSFPICLVLYLEQKEVNPLIWKSYSGLIGFLLEMYKWLNVFL